MCLIPEKETSAWGICNSTHWPVLPVKFQKWNLELGSLRKKTLLDRALHVFEQSHGRAFQIWVPTTCVHCHTSPSPLLSLCTLFSSTKTAQSPTKNRSRLHLHRKSQQCNSEFAKLGPSPRGPGEWINFLLCLAVTHKYIQIGTKVL